MLELHVKASDLELGKKALHAAKAKLPMLTEIKVSPITHAPEAAEPETAAETEEPVETPAAA